MAKFIEVKSKTFYDVISNLINDQEDSDKLLIYQELITYGCVTVTTNNIEYTFYIGNYIFNVHEKEDYSSDVPLTDDDIKGLWDLWW